MLKPVTRKNIFLDNGRKRDKMGNTCGKWGPQQQFNKETTMNTGLKKTWQVALFVLASSFLLTADSYAQGGLVAMATIRQVDGSGVFGTAFFVEKEGTVFIQIGATGLEEGFHGAHIHMVGNCGGPGASMAGAHFNPTNAPHGDPNGEPGTFHAGDLDNLEAVDDGTGFLKIATTNVTLSAGMRSIVGRAIIIDELEDDFTTQPAGGTGNRIACGVIQLVEGDFIPELSARDGNLSFISCH
jgi:Cu-Zn family superoxide dismutase